MFLVRAAVLSTDNRPHIHMAKLLHKFKGKMRLQNSVLWGPNKIVKFMMKSTVNTLA